MKKNKFIIITTMYNVERWLDINIAMTKYQTYENFEVVLIDDYSQDNTYRKAEMLIEEDDRFHLIQPGENLGQGGCSLMAMDYVDVQPQDIFVEIDGDDWLSSVFVLDYLNGIYQDENIWMTYGQYQIYPTGRTGGHWMWEINDQVNASNTHRDNPFPYSHLKTYKAWLYNNVLTNDLKDPMTGDIWRSAWDHALCLPMVEMAGKDHIHMSDNILYILNRHDELQNEGRSRSSEQKNIENRIRQGNKYQKII